MASVVVFSVEHFVVIQLVVFLRWVQSIIVTQSSKVCVVGGLKVW